LPYALAIANQGWKKALRLDPHLKTGLNVCEGKVTCEPVARELGYTYVSADDVLA